MRKALLAAALSVIVCVMPVSAQPKPMSPTYVPTGEELEYLGRHDHRHHASAASLPAEWLAAAARSEREKARVMRPGPYVAAVDRAWTVMLCKAGIVPRATAAKVLRALEGEGVSGGEPALKKRIGGDPETAEDLASVVNLGRTLQEPMSRMQLREKQLDVIDAALKTLATTLDVAEAHVDTIMPGCTHLTHAQPTTYAAYLLAVHDTLVRGLEQLELAYKQTNENTAGCGAVSGTGWPVDRQMVTELLGFDKLMEPTYQAEGAQDYATTTMFGLTNMMTLLSRVAIDHNIWAMEGVGYIRLSGPFLGVSSLMPQKAMSGSEFERIRIAANQVIGHMMTGVIALKGEPLTDMLPIYEAWRQAVPALCETEEALTKFPMLLRDLELDKELLLQHTRDGFSGAPDLAIKLIRDKGFGGRRAHRITAVFVRLARQRGLKPYQTTGELLDEAAKIANEKPPRLTTAEVREMLDPVKFIERHNNVGDPHPNESRRMIAERHTWLANFTKRQAQRREKLAAADRRLAAEIEAILAEAK